MLGKTNPETKASKISKCIEANIRLEMYRHGENGEVLSKVLDFGYMTWLRRMRDAGTFTVNELQQLCRHWEIPLSDLFQERK